MKKDIVRHGSLFSGIGGFDLAAKWCKWINVFHCEINPFCRQILKYYFPKATSYEDIRKTDFSSYRGKIDVLTGGFPCQPYSVAGKRMGKDDTRHLWPAMFRAVQQIRPDWVVGENVFGIVSWNEGMVFEEVHTDLENEGYEVQSYVLPAAAVGAPHRRDRVWFIAHRIGFRRDGKRRNSNFKNEDQAFREELSGKTKRSGNIGTVADTHSDKRFKRRLYTFRPRKTTGDAGWRYSWNYRDPWKDFPSESPICIGNDGVPALMDTITFSKWRKESIKAAGNAIVPQIAYRIFRVIQLFIDQDKKTK
jgi:DNA (cytosine-5)-methyltransferase 1